MAERQFGVFRQPLSVPARVALFYAAMFSVTGAATPYLPVWLNAKGLSVGEIGLLTVVPLIVRIFAMPAVGFVADVSQAHRRMVIGLSTISLAAWVVLSSATGLWVALVAMLAISLGNSMTPLVEAIAMAGVRTHAHDYGRIRLWGSAAFVVANLGGGWWAGAFGNERLIWLMMAGAAATFCVAFLLPQPDRASDGPTTRRAVSLADAKALLSIPNMGMVLLAAGAVQGAHGMFYTYGTLHWQTLGIDPRWFGVLWGGGLVTEIGLFFWSQAAVRRVGMAQLLVFGAGLSVFRWTLMALDPPLALLAPLQVLHGLTYGASHLGAMHLLARIAPPEWSATAQSLYALVSMVGIIVSTTIAAGLYGSMGGTTYLAMAAMAGLGLVAAETVRRRQTS